MLSVVVAPYDERAPDVPTTQDEFETIRAEEQASSSSFTDSFRRDICINLNLDIFILFAGGLNVSWTCCCCG